MKMLLKITQEKFKNEVLTNKNLETHEDIVLNNPYKQGSSPNHITCLASTRRR